MKDSIPIEEEKLRLEREKLELEKRRLSDSGSFSARHFGVILSSSVALAAAIVSGSQVWVSHVTKDKELELASRRVDLQRLQNESEINQARLEQRRRYHLDVTRFIFEHQETIFSENPSERERIRNIILAAFPPEITQRLFTRLETTTPQHSADWQRGVEVARLQIAERVIQVVQDHLGIAKSNIQNSSHFVQDLGADELDIVEMVLAFEEEFAVEIPDEEASKMKTVEDVVHYVSRKF